MIGYTILQSLLYFICVLVILIITSVFLYYKWIFRYWKRRGLINLPPSLPFGNFTDVFKHKTNLGVKIGEIYTQCKAAGHKHVGTFLLFQPVYLPLDRNIVNNILKADFENFSCRYMYINEKDDPLTSNMFTLPYDKWRGIRNKITPLFAPGKIKGMDKIFADTSSELNNIIQEYCVNKNPINISEVLCRFTTDIIGRNAFGLDCNSLKDPESKFYTLCQRYFKPNKWEQIKYLMQFVFPNELLELFHYKRINSEIDDFFMNTIKEIIEYREKNNVFRNDFMHMLLQLKNRGVLSSDGKIEKCSDTDGASYLSFNEVAGQCFLFFLAGFETSANTFSFALYEIARRSDIQDKVRKEIHEVLKKHDNKVSYDAVIEMTYMDKVINEALRYYPSVPAFTRKCTKDYKVPDTEVTLKKGTQVFIPVMGIHRDPEYYSEPEKFDPERIENNNEKTRLPGTFLAFGDGPRYCMGLKYAMVQIKYGLANILKEYKFTVNSKTIEPLEFGTEGVVLHVKGSLWLDAQKL